MEKVLLITVALLVFISCNPSSKKNAAKSKQFFEYDAIDYYYTNYDQSQIRALDVNRSRTEIDSLKYAVILGDIPRNINDLSFIDKLESIGFRKSFIDKAHFSSIDSLFKEKSVKESIALSCVHLYRDILIFRKQKKVIGIAKICFSCMANQITGTNANTENFGQEGDYGKLEKILRK